MKRLVEFPLEDGSTILVEVDAPAEPGMVSATRGGDTVARAQQTFEAALDRVRPAAQTIIQKLRALHDPPDEIGVEFGLKMSAEAGAFVAAAGVEANYKVTLTWKREAK
ncbi:MAG: hypothetical protein D6796_14850 [Caldilineae bacterium]|nr:MAG: hypothetical protein D6796_14850 [Caldilineae bacterium]